MAVKVLGDALVTKFTGAGLALFDENRQIKRPPTRARCMRQAGSLIDRKEEKLKILWSETDAFGLNWPDPWIYVSWFS